MDRRNFIHGRNIPIQNYCDQPYMVQTDDKAWLLGVTTGPGNEGDPGQHITTMRTRDRGATWEDFNDLEPQDGPEASYCVFLKIPSGRIYCFYNHNTDNVRKLLVDEKGTVKKRRLDLVGHFVFRFSDDHGRTWSEKRYDIPMRDFEIDRSKPMGPETLFFWNTGRTFALDDAVYVPFSKVGHEPGSTSNAFMKRSEGAFVMSPNLLTEKDPERIRWETLPDGDFGLRAPAEAGPVAEEQQAVVMDDGTLYCAYRTSAGYLSAATSTDRGRTWKDRHYAVYASDGRPIKQPRACAPVWKVAPGRYLLWFHNNSMGIDNQGLAYGSRNLVWFSAGREIEGAIRWSEPEIGMYVDGQGKGLSYPDLIEEDGRWYISATQKTEGRICEMDSYLLRALQNQMEARAVTEDGLAVDLRQDELSSENLVCDAPRMTPLCGLIQGQDLPLNGRGGLTIDIRLCLNTLEANQIFVDTRAEDGSGYVLRTSDRESLIFEMCDGWNHCCWEADPDRIHAGSDMAVTLLVDGGAKAILWVVNGILCDGGSRRTFGYGRFSDMFKDVSGGPALQANTGVNGVMSRLRIYGRCLLVSEAVGHHRADGRA
jgi:hypothetical protein